MEVLAEGDIIAAIAKRQRIGEERARQIWDDTPKDSMQHCMPIGKNCKCDYRTQGDEWHGCDCEAACTFRVLEAGPLLGFAEENGKAAELEVAICPIPIGSLTKHCGRLS